MQSRKILSLFLIAIVFNFLLTNCKKDDGPTDSGTGGPQTGQAKISSLESGSVSTSDGFKLNVIPGTVPANSTGASANVTFSIETKVTPTKELPATATRRSDFIKTGPDGFAFRWPVKITIPFSGADASEVKLLYLDPLLDKWRIIPANEIDNTAKTISADVIYLGYFCAATVTSSFSKASADDSDGGFEFTGDPTYYYTLTVASVSNWKYSSQAAWYSNILGASGSTGSYPTGGPLAVTHIHLPQASYQIWISRTKPGTLSTLPVLETYSVPATGTISGPVTYTGPLSTGQGWTTLSMPGSGAWVAGSPANWPLPTTTYGTGDFQATLTWINNSTKATDIDLHLFGPNNLHVYWSSKTSSDGSLQLDRDWRGEYGNAIENIYSLSTMPSGQYTIRVNLYSGSANNYGVRIVRFGTVKTYTGTLTTSNSAEVVDNMITLETFTK
jgi:hypothetical protein